MTEDRSVRADRSPYDARTPPVVAGIGMPRLGVWAWAFVGIVAATAIIVTAFAAVKEIMLPLTFAVVLAIIFKPMAVRLTGRGMRPGVAAGIVVLGLLGLMVLVAVATVQGIVAQRGAIGSSVDDAAAEAGEDRKSVV